MSTLVEKVSDAVNDVTAALSNTSLNDKPADSSADKTANAAHSDAVLASAAEGRRLYIGNLAYATTEGELQSFFKGYLMYVFKASHLFPAHLHTHQSLPFEAPRTREPIWQVPDLTGLHSPNFQDPSNSPSLWQE
jgi:hypothetical protein